MNTEILKISRRVGLIDMIPDYGVAVEIGTDRGGYAKDICTRKPNVDVYTIDPWLPYNEGDEVKDEAKMEEIQKEARETLSVYPNCTIIHDTSMNAVKLFDDNSLDFVFIDGNHEYEAVYEDIVEWTRKVKPGGIIAGHDYKKDDFRKYGVIEAVNYYIGEKKINPLFILRKGSFVDCFMFIKP